MRNRTLAVGWLSFEAWKIFVLECSINTWKCSKSLTFLPNMWIPFKRYCRFSSSEGGGAVRHLCLWWWGKLFVRLSIFTQKSAVTAVKIKTNQPTDDLYTRSSCFNDCIVKNRLWLDSFSHLASHELVNPDMFGRFHVEILPSSTVGAAAAPAAPADRHGMYDADDVHTSACPSPAPFFKSPRLPKWSANRSALLRSRHTHNQPLQQSTQLPSHNSLGKTHLLNLIFALMKH